MRTVDLTPEKQTSEVKTRRLRCLHSSRGSYTDRFPVLSLEGKWLRNAGFQSGDWAHITILDGMLIIHCEKLENSLVEV